MSGDLSVCAIRNKGKGRFKGLAVFQGCVRILSCSHIKALCRADRYGRKEEQKTEYGKTKPCALEIPVHEAFFSLCDIDGR